MRILYIEDNPDTVRMVRKLLATSGHTLSHAPDVRKGLMLAMREKPDVILMDYDLPYVNGMDAIMMLRTSERMKKTPIIMVTASATDAEAAHFLKNGCDGFVPKPIDKQRLLDTIDMVYRAASGTPPQTKDS